jgi:hypothetical protein
MNRRICAISGLLIVLAAATGTAMCDDDEQLYKEGKKAWRSCAACHFVTEPTMMEDDDWLKLNQVTACINAGEMTPRMRKVLDVYLRSPKTLRPLLVNESYKPEESRVCGKLKVPATSGTAFLKAERESIRKGAPPKVRVHWQASESGKILTVPAGKYRVLVYRYYRTTPDDKDDLWTLSVSDVNGCGELDIAEGGVATFDFLPEMNARFAAEETEEGVKFSLAVRNEKDSTLTLSRNGDMCLPQVVVSDADGKELFRDVFENT